MRFLLIWFAILTALKQKYVFATEQHGVSDSPLFEENIG